MKLKELRKRNKLTQKEVAQIINVAQTTYLGYEKETSEPNIDTLIKLANYYHVSLDYLCDRQWISKEFMEIWDLTNEQKENVYLIKKLNSRNSLIVYGYLNRVLQEQEKIFS